MKYQKNTGPCSVEDCTDNAKCRGWCDKHYARWRFHGDPMTVNRRGRPAAGVVRLLTYRTAHDSVVKAYGKASTWSCVDCVGVAHEWSYNELDVLDEMTRGGARWSPHVEFYEPRCVVCHRYKDQAGKKF